MFFVFENDTMDSFMLSEIDAFIFILFYKILSIQSFDVQSKYLMKRNRSYLKLNVDPTFTTEDNLSSEPIFCNILCQNASPIPINSLD